MGINCRQLSMIVPALFCTLLRAQDLLDSPPCGTGSGIEVPRNVAVLTDSGGGPARLRFTNSNIELTVPGVMSEFRQVCQISRERLLIFGIAGQSPLYNISIVDSKKRALLDRFYGYSPLLSPDGRWLIMRRFYPLHGDASFSEQYFVYDTERSPAENRIGYAGDPSMTEVAGTIVYPVEENNKPFDSLNLPEYDVHGFRAHSFFWSLDSKAVVFADMQQRLSLVLVLIGAHAFHTYLHSLRDDELCGALREGQEVPFLELSK